MGSTSKHFKLDPDCLNKQPEEVFDILSKLGEGSYGSVFKALHRSSSQVLAIKQVPVDTDLQEIIKEISIMQQCDSPYVVKYYGSYFKNSDLWIVMEYCGAGSVSDIMRLRKKTLSEDEIAAVIRDTINGLEYLHERRKIHRDVKAGNILLNAEGHAKLADFGVAGQLTDTLAKRNTVIGTPFWMAPEVIQEQGYDCKADIWSLGITTLEMAEGKPPYADIHPMRAIFMIPHKPPPSFRNPNEWSQVFIDFVSQCLIKNPDERLTAAQLLQHEFIRSAKPVTVLQPMIQEALELLEYYSKMQTHFEVSNDSTDGGTMVGGCEYDSTLTSSSTVENQPVLNGNGGTLIKRPTSAVNRLDANRTADSIATALNSMVINDEDSATIKRYSTNDILVRSGAVNAADAVNHQLEPNKPYFLSRIEAQDHFVSNQNGAVPVPINNELLLRNSDDAVLAAQSLADLNSDQNRLSPQLQKNVLYPQLSAGLTPKPDVAGLPLYANVPPSSDPYVNGRNVSYNAAVAVNPVYSHNDSLIGSRFVRSFIDGDFEFIKQLSDEELKARLSSLESEMDMEVDELRRRYQTKRQPILDAIEAKKQKIVSW